MTKPLVKSECPICHWNHISVPSETNEATTADKGRQAPITDYLKELRLLCFDYESTKIDSDYFDRLFELTFNDSIERARREERQRVVEMIDELMQSGEGAMYDQALSDIQSKLESK